MTDIGTWTSGRGVVERWRTEDGREFALEFSMNVEWLRAEVRVFITEPVYGGPVDNVAAFLSGYVGGQEAFAQLKNPKEEDEIQD